MKPINCFDDAYITNGRWPGPTLELLEQIRHHPKAGLGDVANPLRDGLLENTPQGVNDSSRIRKPDEPR